MSTHLHYHKTHIIEYGDMSKFNWVNANTIISLLYDNGVNEIYMEDGSYIIEDAECFSIPRKELIIFVENMKKKNPDEIVIQKTDLSSAYTAQQVIDFFADALVNGDPSIPVVYFEWF